MSLTPDNTCLSQPGESKAVEDLRPTDPYSQLANQQELFQEYTQLRERFQRTTNALASAAHDLKTPLAILNGYIELLQSEKLGPLNERQREVVRDMNASGQRLQHVLQDVRTFSRLETDRLKMP